MDRKITRPFASSLEDLLVSMLGVNCRPIDGEPPPPLASISGIVNVSGRAHGQVALTFPRETASLLVAEMIGVEVDEVDDEMLSDGVGEMANIVVGKAKAELSETDYAFQMSLPRVVADSTEATPGEACHYETELGSFSMYLSIAPKADQP
jgi:chemotaxis protein CheX